MEEEVPDEVQAAMAIKLADNVRALVRKEIADAFADETFWREFSSAKSYTMFNNRDTMAIQVRNFFEYDAGFQQIVKRIIRQQMEKP